MRLFVKSRSNPAYRQNIPEQFAFNLPSFLNERISPIWIHTVSVGEFLALRPLILRILQDTDEHIYLTCTTPTGRAQIANCITELPSDLAARVIFSYLPYDLKILQKRTLQKIKPRAILLMETEIWANLIATASLTKIPVILINARLSERSLCGYLRFQWFFTPLLNGIKIAAQSTSDAERFRKLAPDAQITVIPNIKFAAQKTAQKMQFPAEFLSANNRLFLAASTHSGEDELVSRAYSDLVQKHPDLRLCIAPRHPERREEIVQICEKHAYNAILRSAENQHPDGKNTVFILDTIGELNSAYLAADVAFVGGSLIARGGHNPLEALQAGAAVCFGSFMFNFAQIADELKSLEFVRKLDENTVENLSAAVENLLEYRKNHGNAAILQFSEEKSSGILQAHFCYLDRVLQFQKSPQSAA